MNYTYSSLWATSATNADSKMYGTNVFTVRGDDLNKAHAVNLSVQQSNPEEPLTLDAWSTRSDNAIVRSGFEVKKIAQIVNTVTGAKTSISGRARFELILDDRLTYTQRLNIAAALMGVLASVNATESAGSGYNYKLADSNLYRLVDGLFLPSEPTKVSA